jgi:hypothetical protein
MFRKIALGLALGALATSPFLASAIAAQREAPGSITLYDAENLGGAPVRITRDVENLQEIPAAQGFDGTANDYAFSLKTEGQWQVCMDAGYRTGCMIVDGEVASLGDDGGSISSLRYLGPSRSLAAAAPQSPAPAAATRAKKGKRAAAATVAATAAAGEDWQPMYNVDLLGNDYREIIHTAAGNTWRTCKAACDADGQCMAWTHVGPGRTEHGECYLKDSVPNPTAGACCTSGIKGAPSSGGAMGDDAIARSFRRLGETAGRAAEDEANAAVERKVRGLLGKILD